MIILREEVIRQIHQQLKNNVSERRYRHILGVIDAAVYLARKYDENEESAYIAALFHDYAKNYSKEELMQYMNQYDLKTDEIMQSTYQLLHGKVGAHIARISYNIDNEDILNAIEYHTTGRKGMSKLEKIIYLADFIELGRDYPGVEDLRLISEEGLDKAMVQALNNTIGYVLSMGSLLHTNTIEARNEIIIQLKRKEVTYGKK
ncbi:bis(5'-nucleosyl)-tetraphosphatase (symmetrical) YqeK [Alkaliphilus oremlandii]|uniref:bis(5'-nucleosyl)-tetraphosphatase (symmetrical) n=1 Tax=Alkaliphilus oremlandii (strain OhILAs) TaxID=350688 RepID=A8MHK5_ALKOO|nr:bis(5'-nucleosyl)-tetraphosphatase (symmetrical) YqeK [Alkaliphilus oremlandii]ABW19287.1 metal dependent phosphohydrolase [Alkaliphilus oremlandii OhILAs]